MPRTIPNGMRAAAVVSALSLVLSAVVWVFPSALSAIQPPAEASAIQTNAIFSRKISLTTNDVVYSPATGMLYASVPSSAGAGGNSITPINPATGALGSSVFVGSEPNKMAVANDGQTMYVSLDGAYAIRRFDLQTQTPGAQFSLGQDSFYGRVVANDLAVSPGEPNVLAVARYYRGVSPPEAGVAIFDNGAQRTKTGPSHINGADFLAYSSTPSKLFGGGFYGGLRTMNVDATGIASTTMTTFNVGARIKFDGGLIFSSTGQVINADAGSLLGSFSGVSTTAFVPDTAAGRAYYLVRENNTGVNTLTLKAFDISTFLPVGSQVISGVIGDPTTLIRWGTNGLAFRTSAGELHIVQTSLLPSADPIPTPTPTTAPTATPSPVPVPAFIRNVAGPVNNIAYNPATQTIFASVPSTAGANGNSLAQVDPVAGTIGQHVFIGSEPTKLAVSDDGQTMYVALNGAAAVRRFDVATRTPGVQFGVGLDNFSGPLFPNDIAVSPGNPGTVAVSRNSAGTAVYDNGVQRAQTGSSGGPLQFDADATKLYVAAQTIQKYTVSVSGLTAAGVISTGRSGNVMFFDKSRGLLFTSGGDVIDPETGDIKGSFTGLGFGGSMAVDSAAGRVYFLTNDTNSSSSWRIRAYDINTFLPVGFINLGTSFGDSPGDLVRWGVNGLAFRSGGSFSSSVERRVILVQSSLINATDPAPTPTPTPSSSPTPTPTPASAPTFVRKVSLPANDIVYNAATQTIYASVPSSAGAGGNSITPINPATGALGLSVFIGSEPNRLALADDGRTLYAYLDGAKAVRRFDLQTQAPGLQFNAGTQAPADMEVVPGSPQSLAVSPGVNFSTGVTIYDEGVARPKVGNNGGFYAVLPIEFGADATVLYGYDSYSSGFELVKFNVDASGVTTASVTYNLLSGYSTDIEFAGGLIYSSSGRVVNPETKTLLGTFSAAGNVFAVDATLGRVYFLTGDGFNASKVLRAFDINTFLPLGSVTLPGITGTPTRLLRWGANGLAVRTSGSSSSPVSPNAVYLIQSALVSNMAPIPTGVQFNQETSTTSEFNNTLTLTVSRTGDLSSATTVDYATGGGTATAGSDYTAASGALTFAPGETSKTFGVAIRSDNIFEGNETFNITLSNPSGGAQLAGPNALVVTIFDDDSRPSISSANSQIIEGNSGSTELNIPVTLSNLSVENVSINYATSNGTATAGSDYAAASGALTIPAGSSGGVIKVSVNGDFAIEPHETFNVSFSAPVNGSLSVTNIVATIVNDDAAGALQTSPLNINVNEDAGSVNINVVRSSGASGAVTVKYATVPLSATAGSDYTHVSGVLAFGEGEVMKSFSVPVLDDANSESDETLNVVLTEPTGGATLGGGAALITIKDNDASLLQFSAASFAANEGDRLKTVTVTRTGDAQTPVTVNYETGDGTASERPDYTMARGSLRFGAGETSKSFDVLITDDGYADGDEYLNLTLTNPTGGAQLGPQSAATLTITDNEQGVPSATNPADDSQFYARQHYHDFLNREPDAAGLQFWTNEIESCGANAQCREVKRVNVSAAFFLSIEFQQTGYLVYRLHQTAFNTEERLRLRAFVADTQEISRGVVVGQGNWQQQLEANKQSFVNQFVTRPEFVAAYQSLGNAQFVDALNANTFDPRVPNSGGALTSAQRDQLVDDLNAQRRTRAEVLRAVAENDIFQSRQLNKAFVLMQYFGYLRRNPDAAPDANFEGFNFWLAKLNQFEGNFVNAEMVKAFISSSEYRQRFSAR